MTKKEFDNIIKAIGEGINAPCSEDYKVPLWGVCKDWDADEFKRHVIRELAEILHNNKGLNKHRNS